MDRFIGSWMEQQHKNYNMIKKKAILLVALATLLVFGGLGFLLIPFSRNTDIMSFLSGEKAMWQQVIVGIVFGFVSAKAGWQIVELPALFKTKKFFSDLIRPIGLSTFQIVLISLCAGFGEELFFRGALQPWLGIWITSFAFVMLHGYLNPFNLPLSAYGFYMVLVIGVMGLLTEHMGILTAIIAHTIIDIYLLSKLSEASIPKENEKSDYNF